MRESVALFMSALIRRIFVRSDRLLGHNNLRVARQVWGKASRDSIRRRYGLMGKRT